MTYTKEKLHKKTLIDFFQHSCYKTLYITLNFYADTFSQNYEYSSFQKKFANRILQKIDFLKNDHVKIFILEEYAS